MLQRIGLRIKPQHTFGEGKEVFGVKAQRHHHQDGRDQKDKDRSADELEREMPQNLPRREIGCQLGAIPTFADPVDEPLEKRAEEHADDKTQRPTHHCANSDKHRKEAPTAKLFHAIAQESDTYERHSGGNRGPGQKTNQARSIRRPNEKSGYGTRNGNDRHRERHRLAFDMGEFERCHRAYPSFTLSMPTILS